MKTSTEMSRRTFLKGTGIGALVATGSSIGALAGCSPSPQASDKNGESNSKSSSNEASWLPEEPTDPENIEEELEADVVIVGCGTAGTCAARAAAEEGASVIVIEKSAAPAVCRSGQWAVIGGETNKRWNRGVGQSDYVDPDEVVETVMAESQYYPDRSFLSKWAKKQRRSIRLVYRRKTRSFYFQ